MATEQTLIEELMHNAQVSGNQVLERRLADVSVWFYKNHKGLDTDNLAARQRFLEKGFWCLLEINALTLERMRKMGASSGLWLPKGLMMEGDVMKFE